MPIPAPYSPSDVREMPKLSYDPAFIAAQGYLAGTGDALRLCSTFKRFINTEYPYQPHDKIMLLRQG